ncbi:MAG: hypothetical protein AAF598_20770 [Bacteroidota bacterium]
MANPFKARFILRQHTPIIHFQHDHQGATIRPTEFKSKLDRFLIGQLTKNWGLADDRLTALLADDTKKHWLKSREKIQENGANKLPDHPALDYNLNIKILAKHPNNTIAAVVSIADDFPCYFGGMGEANAQNPKKFTFHRLVQVEVRSTNTDLIEAIRKHIPAFLMKTNFGTRQSKGFGSYYLHPESDAYPSVFPRLQYRFDLWINKQEEIAIQKELFRVIDVFYKSLRSGINFRFYLKPMIWAYLKSKETMWDKKQIKRDFYPLVLEDQINDYGGVNPGADTPIQWEGPNHQVIWRDIFGLSTLQKWEKGTKNGNNHFRADLSKTPIDHKFARFKSPIHFKPIRTSRDQFTVFFEVPTALKENLRQGDAMPESAIKGKAFKLKFSKKNTVKEYHFPSSFDYNDFFQFAFKQDLRKMGEKLEDQRNRGHYHQDFGLLLQIYNQLKVQ